MSWLPLKWILRGAFNNLSWENKPLEITEENKPKGKEK